MGDCIKVDGASDLAGRRHIVILELKLLMLAISNLWLGYVSFSDIDRLIS